MLKTLPLLLLTLAVAGFRLDLLAQAPTPAEWAELKRKADRADTLEAELAQARAEIGRLRAALEARKPTPPAVLRSLPPAVTEAAKTHPPTPPIQTLPTLPRDAEVSAQDLMVHYAADPAAADRRYKKQRLVLRGVVAELDKPMLTSIYKVFLRIPDQSLGVACEVTPPARYDRVYVTGDRTRVVAEPNPRNQITLACVGQTITYRGRCLGLKDGMIRFVVEEAG